MPLSSASKYFRTFFPKQRDGQQKTCYLVRKEERIIKLEILSAMQDETIASLNQEIFRQQQDFLQLKHRIETLEKKLAGFDPPDEIGGNEKPPHY